MLGMDREGFDDGGLSDWKEAKREADMKSRQRKPADIGAGSRIWHQLISADLCCFGRQQMWEATREQQVVTWWCWQGQRWGQTSHNQNYFPQGHLNHGVTSQTLYVRVFLVLRPTEAEQEVREGGVQRRGEGGGGDIQVALILKPLNLEKLSPYFCRLDQLTDWPAGGQALSPAPAMPLLLLKKTHLTLFWLQNKEKLWQEIEEMEL